MKMILSYPHEAPFPNRQGMHIFEIRPDRKDQSRQPRGRRLKSGSDPRYLVSAIECWTLEAPVEFFRYLYDGTFFVKCSNKSVLLHECRVRSVSQASYIRPLNRFTSGFLRNGCQDNFLTNESKTNHSSFRYKWGEIDGHGEIVTVHDTGPDETHPFFNDSNYPIPIGTANPNHRNVVQYAAKADGWDNISGNGTHVAGTVACSYPSTENGPKPAQHEGIAPGAKLFFVDIGFDDSAALADVPPAEPVKNIPDVGSHISSGGWGAAPSNMLYIRLWERAAYDNPGILFVFAVGNEEYLVDAPGDCKNCLAVAATTLTVAAYATEWF